MYTNAINDVIRSLSMKTTRFRKMTSTVTQNITKFMCVKLNNYNSSHGDNRHSNNMTLKLTKAAKSTRYNEPQAMNQQFDKAV